MKEVQKSPNLFFKRLLLVTLALLLVFALTSDAWSASTGYSIVTKTIKQKPDQATEIDIKYPQMSGYSVPGVQQKFNELIKLHIDKEQANFKKEKKEFEREDGQYGLWYNYRIPYQSPALVSVVMEGSVFLAGAHPSPVYYTKLFSLKENRVVGLPDLFKKNSDYMKRISRYSASVITKKNISDEDWINKGTDPRVKGNYDYFYVTKNNLVILFPVYQVAAYAVGPQEVKIPFSTLKDIIDPNGPIGWAVK